MNLYKEGSKYENQQNLDFSILVFIFFLPRPLKETPFGVFSLKVRKQTVIRKSQYELDHDKLVDKFPPLIVFFVKGGKITI